MKKPQKNNINLESFIITLCITLFIIIIIFNIVFIYNIASTRKDNNTTLIVYANEIQETDPIILEDKPEAPYIEVKEPITKDDPNEIINTYVSEICEIYGVEQELVMSIIYHESRYNPKATNGNCLGLMQVSTRWHKDRADKLGVKDFYDPHGNILLGVDYLSELFDKYEDPKLVLMLYNMKRDTAFRLYKEGKISSYAKSVLSMADELKKGE